MYNSQRSARRGGVCAIDVRKQRLALTRSSKRHGGTSHFIMLRPWYVCAKYLHHTRPWPRTTSKLKIRARGRGSRSPKRNNSYDIRFYMRNNSDCCTIAWRCTWYCLHNTVYIIQKYVIFKIFYCTFCAQ